MTQRTVVPSDFLEFLESEYPRSSPESTAARSTEIEERAGRLKVFPHSVTLQVSYPELDFANRWCWEQFGPASGDCVQSQSEYPACSRHEPHQHQGRWLTHWLAKTDYNFGYNEWCFATEVDRDRFREFVPHLNWGENYS